MHFDYTYIISHLNKYRKNKSSSSCQYFWVVANIIEIQTTTVPILTHRFDFAKSVYYNEIMVKYTANGCPSEDDEEEKLANYCDVRHFIHWHVPQETFTKSWGTKMKSKKLGVKKGVSDHWIVIPTQYGLKLVAIEMKREKGGTVSDEQYQFIKEINKVNEVQGFIARGGQEAIEIIEDIEHNRVLKINDRQKKLKTEIEHRERLRKNKSLF